MEDPGKPLRGPFGGADYRIHYRDEEERDNGGRGEAADDGEADGLDHHRGFAGEAALP